MSPIPITLCTAESYVLHYGLTMVLGAHRRVLIVEDNTDVGGLLRYVLERDGWIVDTAQSGAEALELLSHGLPDVVLLDLSMPGITGLDVLNERARHPTWMQVPVLAMSADRHLNQAVRYRGASGFLPKPFTVEELRVALRDVLRIDEGPIS